MLMRTRTQMARSVIQSGVTLGCTYSLVMFSCAAASGQDASTSLSPSNAREISLFNGKTLEGWHAVPADSARDWSVQDGAIVGIGSADKQVYLAWNDEEISDFELRLRYRLPAEGNTGVEIRAIPDSTGKRPFEGYHADIGHVDIGPHILGAWDLHFGKKGKNQRKEHACPRGSHLVIDEQDQPHLTTISQALTAQDVRDRDWNEMKVTARGNHFEFFVNGKPAAALTDNASFGRLEKGTIGLQIHDRGMRVEFKDIWLKKYP